MSIRFHLFAASAVLLASTSGASFAADTAVACAPEKLGIYRQMGHPGKSVALPRRTAVSAPKPLILASFTEARGGRALIDGRTQRALAQLDGRQSRSLSVGELTNLCVAQTVMRQWPQAGDACNAAVASALDDRSSGLKHGVSRKFLNQSVAVAYSNRAVMSQLSGNPAAAHNDLAAARTYAPNASFVVRNTQVTQREPVLACLLEESLPMG